MAAHNSNPNRDSIIAELVSDMDFFGLNYTKALAGSIEKWRIAPRTFDRYWALAKKEYEGQQQEVRAARLEVLIEAEVAKVKAGIMDKHERMEVLSQIARAEITLQREVLSSDGIQALTVVPEYNDRKAAIAELNKMDGEYAPIRKETKHSGEMTLKQDLSQLSTAELLERAQLVKQVNG